MIRLFTGQPGHGKTQRAISEGLKYVKDGRAVYAGNIKGLDYAATGFLPLASFADWESLPDNSVVIWDECYDHIRKPTLDEWKAYTSNPKARVADIPAVWPYVQNLATHRHRGFDFILIAQQTKQLDGFVSGLIEEHWHFRRRFQTKIVRIKKWDHWQPSAQKAKAIDTENWRLDKRIWAYYKSATAHTGKVSVPWYFYAFPVLLALIAWLIWFVINFFATSGGTAEAAPTAQAQYASASRPTRSERDELLQADKRKTDPGSLLVPRIPGAPWSAPAYDDVPFVQPPRLACMSTLESCTCLTSDQGTRYPVKDAMCRHIARFGSYDPTFSTEQREDRHDERDTDERLAGQSFGGARSAR